MNWLAIATALFIMLLGLIGTLVPMLPGAPLIFLGMLIYGLIDGFEYFNAVFWLGQSALLVLVFAVDYISGALGAKRCGASKAAIWGSTAGALVGLFIFGPLGIILGPFLGAVIGELMVTYSIEQAFKSGIGTLVGFAGGTLVKLIIEAAMIIWFLMLIF